MNICVDISTIDDNYLWGGNIFFKKAVLQEVDGFDENVGMKANAIGYSAENRVQMKLREKGYKIGYDPKLMVEHLVALHKLKLFWHLKAAYSEGRDGRPIFEDQYSTKDLLKDLLRISKSFLEASYALFIQKNYYWENWVLDVFKLGFRWVGKLSGLSQKR